MWADRVIEGLQVGEYIGLCTGPGGILFEMDQLAHETAEKFSATALSQGSPLRDMLCRIP